MGGRKIGQRGKRGALLQSVIAWAVTIIGVRGRLVRWITLMFADRVNVAAVVAEAPVGVALQARKIVQQRADLSGRLAFFTDDTGFTLAFDPNSLGGGLIP